MSRLRDHHWILDNRKPVRVDTLDAQLRWMMAGGEAQKRVALDKIDGVSISTVFIGAVMSGGSDDRPNLFETMIEGRSAEHGPWQRFHRYATWDEAQSGHDTIVAFTKSRIERGESMDPDAFGPMTALQVFIELIKD